MPVATPALSDEALTEMLSLMKGADSAELKLTVPDSDQRDLPGAWLEIPESSAMIIQRGPHAQRVFEPRGP